jgi:creatinine amidohydrolase
MIRELQPQVRIFLCAINWYKVVDQKPYFTDLGDHAGEMETSVVLHLTPDLVLPLSEAGDGRERKPKLAGMREGWAWAPRQWTKVTADTGIGDPKAATPEKGAAYFTAVTQQIGRFLLELAAAERKDLYDDSARR